MYRNEKIPQNKAKISEDIDRLKEMTKQEGDFNYKIGFMIVIDEENVQNKGLKMNSVFINGEKIKKVQN